MERTDRTRDTRKSVGLYKDFQTRTSEDLYIYKQKRNGVKYTIWETCDKSCTCK